MEEFYGDFMEFLKRPALMEAFLDVLLCAVPIWVAVMIGLVIGWSWRPRWTGIVFLGLRSRFRFVWTAPPGLGARRLWLAFTAFSAFSLCRRLWSKSSSKEQEDGSTVAAGDQSSPAVAASVPSPGAGISPISGLTDDQDIVTEKDLEHLLNLLEGKAGDATWQNMMERSTPNMAYQAWRHEPEEGPPIYRSRTVFEDATPELVRDFFWDDDFRSKWDPMLSYFKLLEECHNTGISVVHWIKKFPFFCSDREYIIGRRIWESGKTYYCVTKGVPYPAIPKRDKPRRVELYFSSWMIKAAQSRKGDGQPSACEVCFVHYEDMGIPKDVAKVGVRHGMWGTVKKLQSGMRAYQHARKSGAPPSQSALSGRITTKIPVDSSIDAEGLSIPDNRSQGLDLHNVGQGGHWKWILIGGTVALACGFHTGIVGKALFFGAAGRLARK